MPRITSTTSTTSNTGLWPSYYGNTSTNDWVAYDLDPPLVLPDERPMWRTSEGHRPIHKLSTQHIINIVEMFDDRRIVRTPTLSAAHWRALFQAELVLRKAALSDADEGGWLPQIQKALDAFNKPA